MPRIHTALSWFGPSTLPSPEFGTALAGSAAPRRLPVKVLPVITGALRASTW
jgi:hypothetical protein